MIGFLVKARVSQLLQHHKGNELWVSILGQGHAKLHVSYEALEGGVIHDALVDLIGNVGEKIDMFHESS